MLCLSRIGRRLPGWGLIGFGVAALPAAFAHHSEAAFDTDAVVAFEGIVTRFAWRNPHVYVDIEARDAAGAAVHWVVETGATPILTRSGWNANSLVPGERVSVRAHPERGDRKYALLLTLEKADGSILEQKPREADTRARAVSLQGRWRGYQPTIGPFFEQFNAVALTARGAAAKAEYNVLRDSPAADCIALPPPGSLIAASLYLMEFELGEEVVKIRSELLDAERTIYLDGRDHPAAGAPSNQGHSIGWWDGETLVVDTRLLAEHRSGNGEGVPTSPAKHVVERYTLIEGGERIRAEVFLEDSEYLMEPFEGYLELRYAPDSEFFRYNCEIEVSRRFTQGG